VLRKAAAEAAPGPGRAHSLAQRLIQLRDNGVPLCNRSKTFLSAEDNVTASAYLTAWVGHPLSDTPYATCMSSIPLSSPDEGVPSSVFVGDEACGISLLDTSSFSIARSWKADGVPSCMCATGALLVPEPLL
jgi:hypothetical protein